MRRLHFLECSLFFIASKTIFAASPYDEEDDKKHQVSFTEVIHKLISNAPARFPPDLFLLGKTIDFRLIPVR